MADLAELTLKVGTQGVDNAKRALTDLARAAEAAAASFEGVDTASVKAEKGIDRVGRSLESLKKIAATYLTYQTIKQVIEFADSFKLLEGRLSLVTKSTEELTRVQQTLLDISQKTRTSYETTATLYTRLSQASGELGRSQKELLAVTQAVQQATILSGASAGEAAATVLQFSQALASGRLQGDEFRSISENNIRLMRVFAEGLGVTVGQLKSMATAGELTSQVLVDSVLKSVNQLNSEMEKMPLTVGQAFTGLSNQFLFFVGELDKSLGLTNALAKAIQYLSEGLGYLGQLLTGVSKEQRLYNDINKQHEEILLRIAAATGDARKAEEEKRLEYIASTKASLDKAQADLKVLETNELLAKQRLRDDLAAGNFKAGGATSARDFGVDIKGQIDQKRLEIESMDKAIKDANANYNKLVQDLNKPRPAAAASAKDLEQTKKIQDEVKDIQALTEAQRRLYAVASEGNKTTNESYYLLLAKEEALKKNIPLEGQMFDQLVKSIEEQQKYNETVRETEIRLIAEKEARKVTGDLTSKQAKLIIAEVTEREKLQDSIKRETDVRKLNKEITEQELQDQIKLQKELQQEIKKQQEEAAKPFIKSFERIEESLADSLEAGFKDGFGKGKGLLSSFADILKNTFYKTVAEGLSSIISRNLFSPLISGAASLVSGSGVAGQVTNAISPQGGGLLGGGGGLSNLFSMGKLVGSLGNFSNLGGFSAINQFGAQYLGTGLPGLSGGLTGATLSSLGAAGGIGGFIGGLNLFGGNPTGSSIGGTLGGIGGQVLGTAVSGTAGAALGATVGSVVPIVGTVIGAALGSALGGLFGGKEKAKAVGFSSELSGNQLGDPSFRARLMDPKEGQKLFDGFNKLFSTLQGSGINFGNARVFGEINTKRGSSFGTIGPDGVSRPISIGFDPNSEESAGNAIAKLTVELAKMGQNSGAVATALANISTEGRKAEDILGDLAFAAQFDKLGQAPEVIGQFEIAASQLIATFEDGQERTKRLGLDVEKYSKFQADTIEKFFEEALNPPKQLSPFQQQLKDLDTKFADLKKAAEILGYSFDQLSAKQAALKQRITDEFNQNIQQQILSIIDPAGAAIVQLSNEFVQLREDAKAAGADMALVDQLYNVKLKNALKQQAEQQISNLSEQIRLQEDLNSQVIRTRDTFRQLANTLGAFRNSLLTDRELSPLSPEERLKEARRQFEANAALAQLGNEEALNKLPDYSKQLLEASKDYYGNFDGYIEDFDRVQDVLQKSQDVASRQANIAEQQLATSQQQVSLLQQQLQQANELRNTIEQSMQQLANSIRSASTVSPDLLSDQSLLPAGKSLSYLDEMSPTGLTVRQHHTFARMAGYTGEFGSGGWNAYARNNSQAASEFNRLVQAAGGRPIAFANGGYAPSYEPYIAGENGPEMIWSRKPSYVSNAGETRRMMSGGMNSDVTEMIRALIEEIRAGNQTYVSGTQMIHEVLTEICEETKQGNTEVALSRYKMSAAR